MINREKILNEIQDIVSTGDFINGKILIDEYKKNFGSSDEVESMEAIINMCNENYEMAINNVREGLKYNILNSDLYYTMGNIYESLGEYNRAYLCYEQSLYMCNNDCNKSEIINSINELKNKNKVNVNKMSFVILTCNQLEYTKVCIESIRNYCNKDTYEIIVVDNHSTDGTVEWLKAQEDIKAIYNDDNKAFSKGYNQGIEIANKDNDIMLLNNDIVLMINSIFNLRMALYSEENVGATGAVSNSVSNCQMISEKFDNFDEYIKFATKNNITNESLYEEKVKLSNFTMLIKRDVLESVGYLDEDFETKNFDDDISLKILIKRKKLLLCNDSYVYNFNFKNFNFQILQNDLNQFKRKWGFSVQYSTGIRNDIISLIKDDINKPIRVLEVGCACGATLLKIKNIYKYAEIYGIELDENSAKIAKCFADVRAENIENVKLSYKEKFFDYIIFGDVLEHLYNPKLVLTNMKKYLKDDGYLIASIPNVMHYSVIKNLLKGNWTYEDAGILDKTHLRFFTLNEIQKLFISTEYKIDCVGTINIGVSDEDKTFIDNLRKQGDIADEYQFLTYQYLIKASNN